MRIAQERGQAHALGREPQEVRGDAVELWPSEQTAAEMMTKGAVDLRIEVARNRKPFVNEQLRGCRTNFRPYENLDGE